MVEFQKQVGLHQLGLDCGRAHGEHRLHREDGRPLGHGPDIARETEVFQIVEKALPENAAPAEVGDVLLVKVQVLHIVHDLLQPRCDGVAAIVGHAAEKHVKITDAILHVVGKVAVAHGQFIEIAQHGQIDSVCAFHSSLPFCFSLRVPIIAPEPP